MESSAEVRSAVAELRTLKIDLIDGPLESEAYYDLLASADILLQPHDPAYYRMQSSGVFTEGRAAGLITIVPAETTMAEEISRTGGGIAVDDWTADAYVRAIRHCVANFDQLATEARTTARSWKKLHSRGGTDTRAQFHSAADPPTMTPGCSKHLQARALPIGLPPSLTKRASMICRVCNSTDLENVIDLGEQPWCNNFLQERRYWQGAILSLAGALLPPLLRLPTRLHCQEGGHVR